MKLVDSEKSHPNLLRNILNSIKNSKMNYWFLHESLKVRLFKRIKFINELTHFVKSSCLHLYMSWHASCIDK